MQGRRHEKKAKRAMEINAGAARIDHPRCSRVEGHVDGRTRRDHFQFCSLRGREFGLGFPSGRKSKKAESATNPRPQSSREATTIEG